MSGNVLVVEDDALLARATAQMLLRHGWQTELAGDAATALQALRATTLTAVICDLQLPGDSGLAVIRQAAAHPSRPRIIAVSGMLDAAFFLTVAQRAGAHSVLSKPVSEADLLMALNGDGLNGDGLNGAAHDDAGTP